MSNVGVVWGGGGVIFFLHFMLFPTFPEKNNSGNKKQFGNSGNLYPIYKKKIVVLASEPVGGRSRATELPCLTIVNTYCSA